MVVYTVVCEDIEFFDNKQLLIYDESSHSLQDLKELRKKITKNFNFKEPYNFT